MAVSCKSAPVVIDETMTTQELIQKGQDAYQEGKYKMALTYYQAVIDKPEITPANYIEARYEIGHLYMKKKNYKAARPIFEEIQELFRNTMPGILPAAYNKLAEIELAKIPDRQFRLQKSLKKKRNSRNRLKLLTNTRTFPCLIYLTA